MPNRPEPVIAEPPGTPPEPFVSFTAHAAANGFDFSTDERFGFVGDAFVACFGDAAPVTTLAGGHVDAYDAIRAGRGARRKKRDQP